ncbi:hypothetical protein MUP01_07565 [Candidatus Bathyarchaeota archaeon]|nr:hypothetical protein [Candidatus Bathyarchaeota archaeon]
MVETFKDYKAAISETVRYNLELLEEIPLPKSLSLDGLKEFFRKDIPSQLSKDTIFEKTVEVSKYASNISQYLGSYFREIFVLNRKLMGEMDKGLFHFSKIFLNSDLPISFLRTVERSILAHKDYVAFFDKEIRKEHRDLIIYRSNRRKFDKVCDAHNKWAALLEEKSERIDCERTKLFWYIDFNNSNCIDEIFADKFIKMELLDKEVLGKYLENLQKFTTDLEELNYPRVSVEPLPATKVSDGAKAILSLMKLGGVG